jgi:hypothetical protein
MTSDIYHFKVGTFDCAIVNDGINTYPGPEKLFFENAPRELLAAALKGHNVDLDTWQTWVMPYPSLVIKTIARPSKSSIQLLVHLRRC